jgi:hypothetical protein
MDAPRDKPTAERGRGAARSATVWAELSVAERRNAARQAMETALADAGFTITDRSKGGRSS